HPGPADYESVALNDGAKAPKPKIRPWRRALGPQQTSATAKPCMFSFFKKKPPADTTPAVAAAEAAPAAPVPERTWREKLGFAAPPAAQEAPPAPIDELVPAERRTWLAKLHNGLRKTGSSIAQVFTGTQIDDALYEELEAALL